jgi:pimeloyl-ACP methyl ester carboxylesterase
LLAKLAKSFAMNKFEITFFLDRGVDVVAYDPRGVVNSQGYPSEAGLYADIEAVGEAVVEKYGAENVWVYGSCGESFAAVALFRKYCHQGMHMLLLTAPGSLERVIGRLNRIVAWLFSWARWALGAPEGSQLKGQQREDGFDSLGKLRGLTGAKGRVVLASTVGDDTAPPEEVAEMGAALRQAGAEVTLFENRAEESRVRPGLTDPHLADPLRHPRFQELLVSKITQ